jgi:surface antigen
METAWATRKIILSIAAGAMILLTGACTAADGPKQQAGAIIGGVGGAVLGSGIGSGAGRVVAVAAGALIGAYVGGEIGASLDRTDRAMSEQSAQDALEYNPDGRASGWDNPNTGHAGSTTPTTTYEQAGTSCREYQTAVAIDGRTETAVGTACRQPDGTWRIAS